MELIFYSLILITGLILLGLYAITESRTIGITSGIILILAALLLANGIDVKTGETIITNGTGTLFFLTENYAFWHEHDDITIDIKTVNVWENITTNSTLEKGNGFTYSGGGLIVGKAGSYSIVHTESLNAGATKTYQLDIAINGVPSNDCEVERKMGSTGDIGASAGSCIIDFVENDNVTIMIRNISDATDINVKHVGFVIREVFT